MKIKVAWQENLRTISVPGIEQCDQDEPFLAIDSPGKYSWYIILSIPNFQRGRQSSSFYLFCVSELLGTRIFCHLRGNEKRRII